MRKLLAAALVASLPSACIPAVAAEKADQTRPIILSSKECIAHGQYLSTTLPQVALGWGMLLAGRLSSEQFIAVWHFYVDGEEGEGKIDTGHIREFVDACAGRTV